MIARNPLPSALYSHCTVRYAEAEGERPRLLLGTQVYFPASSGFTRKMISVPSIRIRTLSFRSLQKGDKQGEEGRWQGDKQGSSVRPFTSPGGVPGTARGPSLKAGAPVGTRVRGLEQGAAHFWK